MVKEKTLDDRIGLLFEPRSVAVVGASRERGKIGFAVLKNIISGGYRGPVYPINPAGGVIEGIPVRRSLEEVEGDIDVAVGVEDVFPESVEPPVADAVELWADLRPLAADLMAGRAIFLEDRRSR